MTLNVEKIQELAVLLSSKSGTVNFNVGPMRLIGPGRHVLREKAKAWCNVVKNREKLAIPSILSKSLRVIGDLESDGDILIDRMIDGDVKTKSLTIGDNGVVNGSITGDTVLVGGTVNGQITGRYVELLNSAKVAGDIVHQILVIEAGTFFHGSGKNTRSGNRRTNSLADRPILVLSDDENKLAL